MGWEPAWKSLVERLYEEGHESPYLARLRDRYAVHERVRSGQDGLEREIMSEMAYALGRAEDKVNLALLELELAAEECERSDHSAQSVAAFNLARQGALRARRDLLIHRDALRFPRDTRFLERYPIPPKR